MLALAAFSGSIRSTIHGPRLAANSTVEYSGWQVFSPVQTVQQLVLHSKIADQAGLEDRAAARAPLAPSCPRRVDMARRRWNVGGESVRGGFSIRTIQVGGK
jgi:hypothetical protein